jgi:cobalt/nickel transport system permease protein
MLEEPFVHGTSQIHDLDPRVRIAIAVLYAFSVALSNRLPTLFLALAFSFALIGMSRLPLRNVAKRVALVNGLVLFIWLIVPITYPGEALVSLGPLTATREGVLVSLRIALKSNAILLAFIALIATSPMATLGAALGRLRVPEKIVHLLLLSYRYIFVMEEEYRRLVRSTAVRGFRPSTGLHTYRTFAYLVGMLFVRASERAERVHMAMLCRGFSGKFHSLYEFSFTRRDMAWLAAAITALLGLGLLEWVHWA